MRKQSIGSSLTYFASILGFNLGFVFQLYLSDSEMGSRPEITKPAESVAQNEGVHRDEVGTGVQRESGIGRAPTQAAYEADETERYLSCR
jgi:hypothetical protein